MAAHRYWRATAFEAYGAGDLELSEIHLLVGEVRVDATATLTASVAPNVSGVVADLQDDVLSTASRWSAPLVNRLSLQWDFGGTGEDVDGLQIASPYLPRALLNFSVDWSNDSVSWTRQGAYSGLFWAGADKIRVDIGGGDPYFGSVIALLPMIGADGSAVFTDLKGHTILSNSVALSDTQSINGVSSAYFGGGGYLASSSADYGFTGGLFTVELPVYPTLNPASTGTLLHIHAGSNRGLHIHRNSAGRLVVDDGLNGTTPGTATIPLDTWSSIKVMRTATGIEGYVDNVLCLSHAAQDYGTPTQLSVGRYSSSIYFTGYIGGLRITGGVARSEYHEPLDPYVTGASVTGLNLVKGRVSASDIYSVGAAVALTYGAPKISAPEYLSIDSGSVKDQITGVLGEGIGRVKGTVATKGSPNQPVHCKVRLIRERDGLVIREAWSNAATGEYDFQYVDEAQTYTVVSYDHLHNYRAVVADNLTPELMP